MAKKYLKKTDEEIYRKNNFDEKRILIIQKKLIKKKPSEKELFNKKIIEYKKFLKEDKDWDWYYIIRLLGYKLKRTRECIRNNNFIDSRKIEKEMLEVEKLLVDINNDNYFHLISREFYKKYGNSKMIIEDKNYTNGFSPITIKYQKETARNRNKIGEELVFLSIMSEHMKQADIEKAFSLMAKNIQNWWD